MIMSMESIGDILERMFKDYETKFLDKNNTESNDQEIIECISSLDSTIKDRVIDIKDLKINSKSSGYKIISYMAQLLLEYGEFKRVPMYYRIIDGQSQDYIFIKNSDGKEVRGFKIAFKNTHNGHGFVTEELYFMDSGVFCKYTSRLRNKEYFRECLREFEYEMIDPTTEWDLFNLLDRLVVVLKIRLRQVEEITKKEKVLNEFLNVWAQNLDDISNL